MKSEQKKKSRNPLIPFIVLSLALHAVLVWWVIFQPVSHPKKMKPGQQVFSVYPVEMPQPGEVSAPKKPPASPSSSHTFAQVGERLRLGTGLRLKPPGFTGTAVRPRSVPSAPASGAPSSPGEEPTPGTGAPPGMTALLPSYQTLSKYTKQYEAEHPSPSAEVTLPLGSQDFRFISYLTGLKRRIEMVWDYPVLARETGLSGILQIDFSINKDGSLSNINVVRSSKYKILDDEAVRAITAAAPYQVFPSEFQVDKITIHATFEYHLISQSLY